MVKSPLERQASQEEMGRNGERTIPLEKGLLVGKSVGRLPVILLWRQEDSSHLLPRSPIHMATVAPKMDPGERTVLFFNLLYSV